MITSPTDSRVQHHFIVAADWAHDTELNLSEVAVNDYSISVGVRDAYSLMRSYNLLTDPQVTVHDDADRTEYGRYAFLFVKGVYNSVKITVSLCVTKPAALDVLHSLDGVALIEALVGTPMSSKDQS